MPEAPNSLTIHRAQPQDLQTVITILEEGAAWLASRQIPQWFPGEFTARIQEVARLIDNGEVYLGYLDGVTIGTFRLGTLKPDDWTDLDGEALYMHSLAVKRAWAGNDLGSRMLRLAEAEVIRAEKNLLGLDCWAGNTALRGYYERAGFRGRGEVELTSPDRGRYSVDLYEKPIHQGSNERA